MREGSPNEVNHKLTDAEKQFIIEVLTRGTPFQFTAAGADLPKLIQEAANRYELIKSIVEKLNGHANAD